MRPAQHKAQHACYRLTGTSDSRQSIVIGYSVASVHTCALPTQGSIKSYSPSDMCASPARDYKYAPLILHDVVLSGLVRFRPAAYDLAHCAPQLNALEACPGNARACRLSQSVPRECISYLHDTIVHFTGAMCP